MRKTEDDLNQNFVFLELVGHLLMIQLLLANVQQVLMDGGHAGQEDHGQGDQMCEENQFKNSVTLPEGGDVVGSSENKEEKSDADKNGDWKKIVCQADGIKDVVDDHLNE